ncbi:hypothetical protein AMECASPLE_037687 [Ameca splendens]|uniref:Uncharacterized protein n=1 Tax=Ameca splendens TaxID=208324 RepID=A0ABV0XL12_9TELE
MQQQKVCVLTCLCIRTSKRYHKRDESDQTREPSHTKQSAKCNSENSVCLQNYSKGEGSLRPQMFHCHQVSVNWLHLYQMFLKDLVLTGQSEECLRKHSNQ